MKEITRSNSTSSPEGENKDEIKQSSATQKTLPDNRHPDSGVCPGVQFAGLGYPFPYVCQDSRLYYQSSLAQPIKVPSEVPRHSPQSGS